MPFAVDYRCAKCGERFEVYLGSSSEELKACIFCESPNITRCLGGNYAVSNDPEVRKAMLQKRSMDHGRKHLSRNVERVRTRLAKKQK